MQEFTRMLRKDYLARIRGSRINRTGRSWAHTAALAAALTALLTFGAGETLAENECGPPRTGEEITCAPSGYDAAEGNIFYSPETWSDDFSIRLIDGLAVDYDSADPDDFGFSPSDPGDPLHAAVWITPGGSDYTGEIALFSSADIMSTGAVARAIYAAHRGESGALRAELSGGSITTRGDEASGLHLLHEGAGSISATVRNLVFDTDGAVADGINASHTGEGDVDVDLASVVISTRGRNADGVYGFHEGVEGAIRIEAQETEIGTGGDEAEAVLAIHEGAGEIEIIARNALLETQGDGAEGVHGLHRSEGDVNIAAHDTGITTMGVGASALRGSHGGMGEVNIEARGATITTGGRNADGVYGIHVGAEGSIRIDFQGGGITTMDRDAEAVLAIHEGDGDIDIDLSEVTIETAGRSAEGVHGLHREDGNIRIDAQGGSVTTHDREAAGVRGSHGGAGDVEIGLRNANVNTDGRSADGVYGFHVGSEGAIRIDAQGGGVTTKGDEAEAVLAIHEGAGDIEIEVRDTRIRTEGQGAESIHGLHRDAGEVRIHVRGADVSTTGPEASGVRGSHVGTGAIEIHVRDTAISTTNPSAHGILAYQGGSGSVRIDVGGGSVHAAGMDASGVRVGNVDPRGRVTLAAEAGEDGYRRQSVTVNGSVTGGSGAGAGVFLSGGGRVVIGPGGTLGADSGVAIRAAGDAAGLHVEMNLADRQLSQVIGDDLIVNDGGETTLLVNGVTLHDGAAGATGFEAPNGAWDVGVAESPTVTGRVFSQNDFTSVFAPRAAVYEALPGFLLRLNGRGADGKQITSPDSGVWVRLSNGQGSYEAGRASVGAAYDFNHFGAEAGLRFSLGDRLTGSVSARYVNGSAEVGSPAGNGELEAEGIGAALGVSWSNASGYFAAARAALTDYDVEASSEKRGRLTGDAGARGYSVGLEAGRRVALDEKIPGRKMSLTPRAWMRDARFSSAGFTDAVNARVSLDGAMRLTGGLGLAAETARVWDNGALSLRISLDVEQALGGAETSVHVSGEKLRSQPARTRFLLGVGGAYRQGPFSLGAELSADGLGSDDEAYSGRLDFGWKF